VSIIVHGIWCRRGKKDENAPALVKTSMAMELQLELADNDEEQV